MLCIRYDCESRQRLEKLLGIQIPGILALPLADSTGEHTQKKTNDKQTTTILVRTEIGFERRKTTFNRKQSEQ